MASNKKFLFDGSRYAIAEFVCMGLVSLLLLVIGISMQRGIFLAIGGVGLVVALGAGIFNARARDR